MKNLPQLVVSDENGNIFELARYKMVAMTLHTPVVPIKEDELIPLPRGSSLYLLPDRTALAWDQRKEDVVEVKEHRGRRVFPVAAFMAPAYVHFYTTAFRGEGPTSRPLPLYCYAAVGWGEGEFVVPAKRVDADIRQDPENMDPVLIEEQAGVTLKRFPHNRLAEHLVENCVRSYCCPAARNFVLRRWEAPLPTSPSCNAGCVGCISLQAKETGVTAPQDRIAFIPRPEEIAEIALAHLEVAPRPVVSFGQGCEGEPLLAGEVIEEAIRLIRRKTDRGIINLNTNGSKPEVVERLALAGLDSIRVSLNSVRKEWYHRYFSPRNYGFEDAAESLSVMKRAKRWNSINYFVFPGFTDTEEEMDALLTFTKERGVNMIQARNLNIDPQWYLDKMGLTTVEVPSFGVREWISRITKELPRVKLGYFNPPREEMEKYPMP
jgi:pyruvate-formate lyase-activating enzyme